MPLNSLAVVTSSPRNRKPSIDYSAMSGAVGNLEEIIQFFKKVMPMFINTQHMISNYQIKVDGDTATGRLMCFNPMEISGNPVFFSGPLVCE